MAAPVALIQGASRGLGLQFCRHILSRHPSSLVVATCRDPSASSSSGLMELQQQHGGIDGRLRVIPLDTTNADAAAGIASQVSSVTDRLDLLVNCAAMLHPSGRGETSLRDVSFDALMATLATNTVGPLILAKSLAPLLQKGNGSFGAKTGDPKSQHKGVIVNMSAKVGSIGDNALGGWYSYRMSKAALNMATKNLSIELGRGSKKVLVVSLHPGTVDTNLSRPYHKNVPEGKLFSTEFSVDSMMKIVDGLTFADSGKFFAWDGSPLPY